MIDVQQVRELVELMVEHGLSEIRVRQGETTVSLRRGPGGELQFVTPGPALGYAALPAHGLGAAAGSLMPGAAAGGTAPAADRKPEDEGLVAVKSPMVGTFYGAGDPESPPFVEVGSEVHPEMTVCIIEAMKVFNEIKADVAGTIERILVTNEQPVEYGQVLMLVRPRG